MIKVGSVPSFIFLGVGIFVERVSLVVFNGGGEFEVIHEVRYSSLSFVYILCHVRVRVGAVPFMYGDIVISYNDDI